jgi:hypothetical protein
MIRRGQSRKAATKARKNSETTLLNRSIKIGLVAFMAVVLFLAVPLPSLGADSAASETTTTQTETTPTEPTETTPTETKPDPTVVAAKRQYRIMLKYRRKADYYYHLLYKVHHPRAHGIVAFSGSLKYETYRRKKWQHRTQVLYRLWAKKQQELQQCRHAGFPRWYCPILVKAAHKKGVASWSRDPALVFIISHESGFNPLADNPTSTAYGLFQMLTERSSSPYQQTLNGLRYIKGRYGSPAGARAFWLSHHWY